VRKLLLATEAHKKREAQKARRQQVKAALLQAQAEELVCSRLLRATLKELEDAPAVCVPEPHLRAHPRPSSHARADPDPDPDPDPRPQPQARALAEQVCVPGYDGAPSSTRVDLEWNLGTEVVRVRVTVRVTIRVTVTVTIRVS